VVDETDLKRASPMVVLACDINEYEQAGRGDGSSCWSPGVQSVLILGLYSVSRRQGMKS